MPSVFEVEKPEGARKFVGHFLGNQLMVISGARERTDLNDDQRFNEIVRARMGLAGGLYVLVHRMYVVGRGDIAREIQQILDMVVEQDVTDAEVRKAIHAKHLEFDDVAREFAAALASMRQPRKG